MSKVIGVLAGVGALNWLLVVFGLNLVELIFQIDILINIVYVVVGLSGIVVIVKSLKSTCCCNGKACSTENKREEAPVEEVSSFDQEKM